MRGHAHTQPLFLCAEYQLEPQSNPLSLGSQASPVPGNLSPVCSSLAFLNGMDPTLVHKPLVASPICPSKPKPSGLCPPREATATSHVPRSTAPPPAHLGCALRAACGGSEVAAVRAQRRSGPSRRGLRSVATSCATYGWGLGAHGWGCERHGVTPPSFCSE